MKKGQIEMLTARQFSERAGVSYPTVMKWLKAGLVPGAKLNENTPLGTYWEIPATSVGKVEKEKPGPKPKTNASNGDSAATDGQVSPAPGDDVSSPAIGEGMLARRARKAGKAGSKKGRKN